MKHILLVASALIILVPASLVAQTTYDLPTGKSLEVGNLLPETFHTYFNNEQLAQSLGRLQPASDYRIVIQPDPSTSTISLMVILTDFNPDAFHKILYLSIPSSAGGSPQGECALTVKLPTFYMLQLRKWQQHTHSGQTELQLSSVNITHFYVSGSAHPQDLGGVSSGK